MLDQSTVKGSVASLVSTNIIWQLGLTICLLRGLLCRLRVAPVADLFSEIRLGGLFFLFGSDQEYTRELTYGR